MRNIKIFSMLRTKLPWSAYTHSSFFIPIKPLFAVQHPKFTSPSVRAEVSPLSLDYWNPFAKDAHHEYEGVNQIFEDSNEDVWMSSGRYLTFASYEPIKLSLLILEIPLEPPPSSR